MIKSRSILSVVLAIVAVVLINFGSVAEAKPVKPATYTSDQIAQIQAGVKDVSTMRDRLPELATLIQSQDWIFARNFIHGPLGELRSKMLGVTRNLLPDAQPEARRLSKLVFDDLVTIDQAADKKNYQLAIRNYAETIRDLDAFLNLVPKA